MQNVKSWSHFLNNPQYIYLYSKETIKNMKKYTDNPLQVRLFHVQENKLNDLLSNESYCRSKGIYSKADVVRNSINNILRDYELTTLGTQ